MVRPAKSARNGRTNTGYNNGGHASARPTLSPADQFMALSDSDKEAIFRELERPIGKSETREMTASERRQWEIVRRGRGRPKIGKGTVPVSLTIEKELLRWLDAYARDKGLSRARLVRIALESFREDVRRYQRVAKFPEERSSSLGRRS